MSEWFYIERWRRERERKEVGKPNDRGLSKVQGQPCKDRNNNGESNSQSECSNGGCDCILQDKVVQLGCETRRTLVDGRDARHNNKKSKKSLTTPPLPVTL